MGVPVQLVLHDGGAAVANPTHANDTIVGTPYNDFLRAFDGNDSISGGEGSDRLEGGHGNDTLEDGLGADRLYGGVGIDTATWLNEGERVSIGLRSQLHNGYAAAGDIVSDIEQFQLTNFNDAFIGADTAVTVDGFGGADKITGSTKSDRIIGGAGADTFKGGAGRDTFIFSFKDTSSSKKKADYILDFSGKSGDRIDLKLIDANVKKAGNQAFSFVGTEAFSKVGQVRYEKTAKDTYVLFNTDADASAEGVIRLKGSMDIQRTWFVL